MVSGSNEWLAGRLVIEMGGRIAVAACGSLLADAGATVVFVETPGHLDTSGKFAHRTLHAAGKRSLAVAPGNGADEAVLADLLGRADIVLTSSDWDFALGKLVRSVPTEATVCNFTALGTDDTASGLSDVEVQALSGVAHTSGFPDGPPCSLRVPFLEYSAAAYGAAACTAALACMRDTGQAQRIEVSLFECAISGLASFLPSVFHGKDPGRFGNGHPLTAPWNAYPTSDGWLMFCSASDAHWARFCEAFGRPELTQDERFRRVADRARNRDAVDAVVADCTRQYDTKTCSDLFSRIGLASGEIVRLDQLPDEANVTHRASIGMAVVPETGQTVRIPYGILATPAAAPSDPPRIPGVDGDRDWLVSAPFERLRDQRPGGPRASQEGETGYLPFQDIRVIEIGQFTTAPLAARHLGTYGADVAKIEPLIGDAAREWQPTIDGLSCFFAMSNSGKTCYKVDLKCADGLEKLEGLLRQADVLVENMKPGSLAGLGLTVDRLREINPRLIYCAITGFGSDSAYASRPAFDTVVQAMSGMMDANAFEGTPLKASVSACDVMGGEIALFAISAALFHRHATGKGAVLDLSMQDIAIWTTAGLWNEDGPTLSGGRMIRCRDGYVFASAADVPVPPDSASLSRDELVSRCRAAKIRCFPVLTVAEALESPHAKKLRPVRMHRTASGTEFPLLGAPLTISPMRLRLGAPPGEPYAL